MSVNVKDAGVWKSAAPVWVKDAGLWKQAQVWVKDAGVWKLTSATPFNLTIAANTQDYDIRAALLSAGWNGTDVITATLTINSGIVVGQNSAAYALDTGLYGSELSSLSIINNGTIIGKGGAGGDGGRSSLTPINGLNGGNAFKARTLVSITNNGTFSGGGGGGGGATGDIDSKDIGTGESSQTIVAKASGGGGGGGAGDLVGSKGFAVSEGVGTGSDGSSGSLTLGGDGGIGGTHDNPPALAVGADGGKGGNQGVDGVIGGDTLTTIYSPGLGGTRGSYADGNANITWFIAGTRLGQVVQ